MHLKYDKKRLLLILIIILALLTIAAFNLRQDQKQAKQNKALLNTSFGMIETDFPPEYIEENLKQIQTEIPRVYELLHVVIALTEPGQTGQYNLNYNSDYYQEVIKYFKPYDDHPAVQEYVNLRAEYSYSGLRKIFAYKFNDNNEIIKNEIYNYSNKDLNNYSKLLEDFAQKSNFNNFYSQHQNYYDAKIKEFNKYTDLKEIWVWLEENYPNRYDSYKVVLSPLVFASHNTTSFSDTQKGFKEIIMFVSSAELFTRHNFANEKLTAALTERMVFTEIDHNYVNPTTDQAENMRQVMAVFGNLKKWNQQSGYGNSALTFNEYMTWATACLYVHDNYNREVYNKFLKNTNDTMKARGFIKFPAFYDELLSLYKQTDKPIYKLYPDILEKSKEIQISLK